MIAAAPDPRPLILTALLAPAEQGWVEGLRRAHYPPTLNRVPAHISLFHQLPGSAADEVRRRLKAVCGGLAPLPATLAGFRSIGRGVALDVHCPDLVMLRDELAAGWAGLLIAQDREGFRPHVTIQNKVTAAAARATLAALAAGFVPRRSAIVALALWRYLDGPWAPIAEVRLRGG